MESDYRNKILSILRTIKRTGIDSLCAYLVSSDFFTAPASSRFHLSESGGLARHSWNVFELFKEKTVRYGFELSVDSVAICSLLHDMCKIGVYKKGKRNVKENGQWIEKEIWEYNDDFPYGHGEKSVLQIKKFIDLSDEEALIVRWHMGFTEPREMWRSLENAFNLYPAVIGLHCADLEAANIIEMRG